MPRTTLAFWLVTLLIWLAPAPAPAQTNPGALYAQVCARCHESTDTDIRAPRREVMRALTPEAILRTLESGSMAPIAAGLSAAERAAAATFVAGRPFNQDTTTGTGGRCPASAPGLSNPMEGPRWAGWGADAGNTRFAPSPGFTAADIPRLRLAWAFGFPGAFAANAQPAVAGGWVFVGGADRRVHALDAKTGCVHWTFEPDAAVRTALSLAPRPGGGFAVFFGDGGARAYALDAATGSLLWKTRVEDHPAARITGAPVPFNGTIHVPVSSFEEGTGTRPGYECCTFRGSLVALDAATGAVRWKSYTIPHPPEPTRKNAMGTQMHGPSGAAIWSAPTLDPVRGAIYVATGNAYSHPAAETSDAVIAFDLGSGRELWHRQVTAGDAYIVGCVNGRTVNCPQDAGPDHDFGQSPILTRLADGRRVLAIAQKSGVAYGLDPDDGGRILWQTRLGKGGTLGGSQWGSASGGGQVYVAISDVRFMRGGPFRLDPDEGGGLHALDLGTGRIVWSVPPAPCGGRPKCSPALSAAVTAMPGAVFSGGVSGILRAHAAAGGHLLWQTDTARDYATVNNVPASGGAMDGPGPVIAGGMLYVTSGYGQWGGKPGNVLLAFSVDGR